jgi:hypothetical protein
MNWLPWLISGLSLGIAALAAFLLFRREPKQEDQSLLLMQDQLTGLRKEMQSQVGGLNTVIT